MPDQENVPLNTLHRLDVVAKRFDTSTETLTRAIRRHQIKGVKLRGQWRISEAELRRIVREGIGPQL